MQEQTGQSIKLYPFHHPSLIKNSEYLLYKYLAKPTQMIKISHIKNKLTYFVGFKNKGTLLFVLFENELDLRHLHLQRRHSQS